MIRARRRAFWTATTLALAGLLVLLAVRAPATWVAASLAHSSDGRIRLVHAQGSAWRGTGDAYVGTADGAWHPLASVSWDFQAAGLLAGEAQWRMRALGHPPGTLWLSPRSWGVRGMSFDLPAALAVAGATRVSLPGLRGNLLLEVADWRCPWRGNPVCAGNASARWAAAGHDGLPPGFGGDIDMTISATDGNLRATWLSKGAPIDLQGTADWEPAGWRVEGLLAGDPRRLDGLQKLLAGWLRAGERPGQYRISASGNLK